jgi:hypothetical protein
MLSDFPVRSLLFPLDYSAPCILEFWFWFWFLCIFPLAFMVLFLRRLTFPCNSHSSDLYPKLSCFLFFLAFLFFYDLRQTLLRMKRFACELAFLLLSLFCFTDSIHIWEFRFWVAYGKGMHGTQ